MFDGVTKHYGSATLKHMTLSITVATPRLLIAASDRRLTEPIKCGIYTERSTKLTVLEHPTGVAFITYNGIGLIKDKTPSDWLWELGSRVKLAHLSLHNVLDAIRKEAERQIVFIPISGNRRHSFIIGARENGIASIYVVSNYERADTNGAASKAFSHFTVSCSRLKPGSEVIVFAAGRTEYLDENSFRKIAKVAQRRGAAGVDVKNLIVKAIVAASDKGGRKAGIGASVSWAVSDVLKKGHDFGLDVPDGTTILELPNLIQRGAQYGDIVVAVGPSASKMWEKSNAEKWNKWRRPKLETSCPNCGAPVPLGYLMCGVCRHHM
ncbi:MAG: hypothetical protein RBT11_20555 [Desulfobacterales bacterium]|jgi:hypothetical protein|nr:hypothetical protein [Desulfobacterales bacterium]